MSGANPSRAGHSDGQVINMCPGPCQTKTSDSTCLTCMYVNLAKRERSCL